MSGVVSGGKAQTVGFRYFMSVHQAICRGPVDVLLEVRVADTNAWPQPGQPGVETTSSTAIQRPELFGGDKKEGGINGIMQVLMGYADQIAPPQLKALVGGRVPDYRGIVSIFYDGLICSINPYPKPWMFRVARVFKGWDGPVWYPEKVYMETNDNGAMIRSMNPAHIIYECCTNRVWGRGLPREFMDDASFRKAADQLFSEGFGLNMKWSREDTLDNFVKDVIDHIGAAVDINRETGLVRLKLIRDDYTLDSLPLFEYDSGLLSIEEDETSSRDDVVNEIVVKFKSVFMNQQLQVRVHNLAAIQSTGNFKSITTDYSGISNQDLALRVAQRDLKANALSGRRYKLSLDRRAWRLAPADVIRVRAPDKGIDDLVLRLGKVSDSSNIEGELTAEAVPDVFGLRDASFIKPQAPGWTAPSKSALAALYGRIEESTYRDVFRGTTSGQAPNVLATNGFISAFAVKPTSLTLGYDLSIGADGEDLAIRSTESFMPAASLAASIGAYDTDIQLANGTDLYKVAIGSSMFIGGEVARVDAISDVSGVCTISRGCVDTVPAAHAAGTICYFPDADLGSDGREYAAGESVFAKLITYTSMERLDPNNAPTLSTLMKARAFKPYPPGNFRIDNKLPSAGLKVGSSFSLSWNHRDRVIQQDKLFGNDAANFGPETGTTYRLRFYKSNNLIRTEDNISDSTFTYTTAMNVIDGGSDPMTVQLESVRDGVASWQCYTVALLRS
jgi:hypothetical protein